MIEKPKLIVSESQSLFSELQIQFAALLFYFVIVRVKISKFWIVFSEFQFKLSTLQLYHFTDL